MIKEATAMTVRKNLGELLNEIQYRNDTILVTKGGKQVAALVGITLFKKIRLMQKEFDSLSEELAKAYSGVSEKAALNEINEAVRTIRKS